MKRVPLFLTLFLSLFIASCFQSTGPELFPFALDDQYGYLDKKGKIVIPFQFDEASTFTDELALVKVENKYGYINKKGVYKINLEFDEATPFFEGVAVVVREGGAPTIINTKGKEIAVLKDAEEVRAFSEGMAAFSQNVKDAEGNLTLLWGFINAKGDVVIPPTFKKVDDFSEGLACVRTEDWVCHYIDKSNNKSITFPKGWGGSSFHNGMAPFYNNEKVGYINKSGKVVITPQYNDAGPFVNDLACVQVGKRWGFINKKGRIVINPIYEEEPLCFDNGLAAVLMGDEKVGIIDKKGDFIIPPQYEGLFPLSDDLYMVFYDDNCGAINKKGEYIINPIYSEPCDLSALGLFAAYKEHSEFGYLRERLSVHSQYFDVDAVIDSFMSNITDNTYFGVYPGQSPWLFENETDKYREISASVYQSVNEIEILPEVSLSRIDYTLGPRRGAALTVFSNKPVPDYNIPGVSYLTFYYTLTGHAQENGELLARSIANKLQEEGGTIQEKNKSIIVDLPFDSIQNPIITFNYNSYGRLGVKIEFPDFLPIEVFNNGKIPDEYSWIIEGNTWNDNPWGYEGVNYNFTDKWEITTIDNIQNGDGIITEVKTSGVWAIVDRYLLYTAYDEQNFDEQNAIVFFLNPTSRLLVGLSEKVQSLSLYPSKEIRTDEQKKKCFTYTLDSNDTYYHVDWEKNGVFVKFTKKGKAITGAEFSQYATENLKIDEVMSQKYKPLKRIRLSIKNGNEFYDEQGNMLATGYSFWSDSKFKLSSDSSQWFLGEYNNQ